jgi:hypothetical protein
MRRVALLVLPCLMAGCISFTGRESQPPDFAAACAGRDAQCKEICGSAGIQAYSCKAAAGEGVDYKCECRKP